MPAGSVTFNATNIGPMDPHELVVVKTDIPAGELPTREDGSFDEDAEGVEVIGEIEEFDVGLTESMTLDLEPGNYVLLCNLVEEEDGAIEAHYQMGMWVAFEVTDGRRPAEVNVTLQEWAVLPDTQSVPAGQRHVQRHEHRPHGSARAGRGQDRHPRRRSCPPARTAASTRTPRASRSSARSRSSTSALTESMTSDLEPGNYVLLCNLVEEEDGEIEAHYQMGMWVAFEVTA